MPTGRAAARAAPVRGQLAAQIAALPQACLRSDRMSALESVWLDDREAMAGEFRHGLVILGRSEMSEGVGRFRAGAGRGGADLDAS